MQLRTSLKIQPVLLWVQLFTTGGGELGERSNDNHSINVGEWQWRKVSSVLFFPAAEVIANKYGQRNTTAVSCLLYILVCLHAWPC